MTIFITHDTLNLLLKSSQESFEPRPRKRTKREAALEEQVKALKTEIVRLSTCDFAAEVMILTAQRDQLLGELKAANQRIEDMEAAERIAEEEMEAAEGSQGSSSGLTAGMAELG
jgi:peroxiredoxin family protein